MPIDQGQVRGQGQEGYNSHVHASEGIPVAEGQGCDREKGRQGQVIGGGNKDGKMKSNESSMKRQEHECCHSFCNLYT